MKRKRPERPTTQSDQTVPPETIDIEEISVETSQKESVPASNKRSWVWNYLKESEESGIVICQVITKLGTICGKKLKKDKSSSTKNLHGHLLQIHHLADPNLSKKAKTNHMDIGKWSKTGALHPKVFFFLIFN